MSKQDFKQVWQRITFHDIMSNKQETSSRSSGGSLFLSEHEDLGVISTNKEPYINDPLASDDDDDINGEGAPLA